MAAKENTNPIATGDKGVLHEAWIYTRRLKDYLREFLQYNILHNVKTTSVLHLYTAR